MGNSKGGDTGVETVLDLRQEQGQDLGVIAVEKGGRGQKGEDQP